MFVPAIKFIFNPSLSQDNFSQLVEASSCCPWLQRREKRHSLLKLKIHIYSQQFFPDFFLFVMHDHISHLKYKIKFLYQGFIKYESNVTNLFTFHDFASSLFYPKG
jgi:hypothetical protein